MGPKIIFLRFLVLVLLTYPLYLSQRYWGGHAWRLAGCVPNRRLCMGLRVALVGALVALNLPVVWFITIGLLVPIPKTVPFAISGLWLSSTFLSWVGVQLVLNIERMWAWLITRLGSGSERRIQLPRLMQKPREGQAPPARREGSPPTDPPLPSRRYFFQTASYIAGAVPLVGSLYGFAVERLHFRVERVEIPVPELPDPLDGLSIGQLSDIHMGGYMPREQVRRAVQMANEMAPDLFVVTGDFITAHSDPLLECIEELAELRAPLGVWCCNGNHEIYAGVEDFAAKLFQQAGMHMLRMQNAELTWRGAAFNLLGVDHQITHSFGGLQSHMLRGVEPLVRAGMPNILLSHNPNAFYRAAEIGVDFTIAGHTHGGQIQVEIINSRLNPARFFTEFVAGLYSRRMGALQQGPAASGGPRRTAYLYVNRGLGTIGAPVRIGSLPEITLLVLRRA